MKLSHAFLVAVAANIVAGFIVLGMVELHRKMRREPLL